MNSHLSYVNFLRFMCMWLIRECIDQSLPLFAAVLAVSNFIMCLIVAVHYFLLRNAKCSFFDHLNV